MCFNPLLVIYYFSHFCGTPEALLQRGYIFESIWMTGVVCCYKVYMVVCGFAIIWLCPKRFLSYSLCFLYTCMQVLGFLDNFF